MHKTGIGASVPRKEDYRFLTGSGRFSDDIRPTGALAATVLRSPLPHAGITAIDVEGARRLPGVRLVLTAQDLEKEGVGPIPSLSTTSPFDIGRRDGGDAADPSQYPLARERVRYTGEPVAFVVADTIEKAQDDSGFARQALAKEFNVGKIVFTARDGGVVEFGFGA